MDPSAPKQTLPNTPAPQTGGVVAPPRPAPAAPVASRPAPAQLFGPQTPNYGSIGPGAAAGTAKGLDSTFNERLQAMIAASGGRLRIVSGFRSVDEQAKLFADAVKKYGSEAAARKWVAPPGQSHHNMGIAVDLGGDIQWAHDHASQFGLYFPMSWEPWHIEPTGSRTNAANAASVGYAGPKATTKGYTTPRTGYGLNPDPAAGGEDGTTTGTDPRMSMDYQMASLGALLDSPDFAFGGPAALPSDFSSMPMGTA